MRLLEEGLSGIKAFWDLAGKDEEQAALLPFENFDLERRYISPDVEALIVTLPAPQKNAEGYFIAMV